VLSVTTEISNPVPASWGTLSLDVLDRLDAQRDRVSLRRVVDGEWK